jgi:hypothetical protein
VRKPPMRLLLSLVIISLSFSTQAQVQRQRHGTVNIILANPQGIVAVTDSMLSPSTLAHAQRGQKLFQIDSQTICTIAGWYSSTGPTIDGVHYPAFTAVSNVIRWFTAANPAMASLPIQKKIEVLANAVRFGLETMASVDMASGGLLSSQPSQITLAGFDSGHLKIAQISLVLRRGEQGVTYEEQDESVREVNNALIWAIAGVPQAAAPILDHPSFPRPSDPILQMYADAMAKDGGKSLTLEEMQQIAKALEYVTARRFSNIVGGLPEVAVIKDGKAEVTAPFDNDQEPPTSPAIMMHFTHPQLSRNAYGMLIAGPGAEFVEDGVFSHIGNQQIDHIFFFRTTFDQCVLYYGGTPNFIFDRSNTVLNSKLVLYSAALLDSPGVKQIRADFPDLPIEDITGKSLTSPE